ncbi:hypothetical protein Tco_1027259 [Tanacetum coccineum]
MLPRKESEALLRQLRANDGFSSSLAWPTFENEGFILDDIHDNEEDGQHINDGKQNRRRKKRSYKKNDIQAKRGKKWHVMLLAYASRWLTHFQSNKLAERLNGYKPLAELAMEQPSPVSVVDAFYTEDPPSPIQKKPCAYKVAMEELKHFTHDHPLSIAYLNPNCKSDNIEEEEEDGDEDNFYEE